VPGSVLYANSDGLHPMAGVVASVVVAVKSTIMRQKHIGGNPLVNSHSDSRRPGHAVHFG
jgi:hypothetical protein